MMEEDGDQGCARFRVDPKICGFARRIGPKRVIFMNPGPVDLSTSIITEVFTGMRQNQTKYQLETQCSKESTIARHSNILSRIRAVHLMGKGLLYKSLCSDLINSF